jgi:hypothetical protein
VRLRLNHGGLRLLDQLYQYNNSKIIQHRVIKNCKIGILDSVMSDLITYYGKETPCKVEGQGKHIVFKHFREIFENKFIIILESTVLCKQAKPSQESVDYSRVATKRPEEPM